LNPARFEPTQERLHSSGRLPQLLFRLRPRDFQQGRHGNFTVLDQRKTWRAKMNHGGKAFNTSRILLTDQ
jgi:hypothetical protein